LRIEECRNDWLLGARGFEGKAIGLFGGGDCAVADSDVVQDPLARGVLEFIAH